VTDDEFLDAFERCVLPKRQFSHAGHVRLAYLYLRRHGRVRGGRVFRLGVRRYAGALGVDALYNETLTTFWWEMIADALARHRHVRSAAALVSCEPQLADRGLQYRYWSRGLLGSPRARLVWTEPDLAPLAA
jgi:hypothetical protein